LETDIEKAREEGNWKKVIELATQLKDKGERGGHFLPSFVAVLGIRIHHGSRFHWVSVVLGIQILIRMIWASRIWIH
jgi:hypothetical protein